MTNETIKIQIEIPSGWLNVDTNDLHSLGEFNRILRTDLKTLIKEQAIEKIMQEIKLPEIHFDDNEIKKEILNLLATRAMDNIIQKDNDD